MGHSKRANRGELEQRRTRVWDLRLSGLTVQVIADQLNVDRKTVMRDLKAILEERLHEVENRDKIAAATIGNLKRMSEEMWKMYRVQKNANIKLGAMNQLNKIMDKMIFIAGLKHPQSNLIVQQIGTVVTWEDLNKILEEGAKHRYELLERPAEADEQRRDEATD